MDVYSVHNHPNTEKRKQDQSQGGYSGINVMGGGGPKGPNILHPKNYKTGNFSPKKYMTFIP